MEILEFQKGNQGTNHAIVTHPLHGKILCFTSYVVNSFGFFPRPKSKLVEYAVQLQVDDNLKSVFTHGIAANAYLGKDRTRRVFRLTRQERKIVEDLFRVKSLLTFTRLW